MPGRFDEVVPTPPSILFGDAGLVLDGGDLTIELIPTPGHTRRPRVAVRPELDLVLAGDAAEVPFPHVDTGAGLVRARASLQRLMTLGARHVLPCHGGTTDPVVLERNLAWLDAVAADPDLPYETRSRSSATAGRTCSRCTGASTPTRAARRASCSAMTWRCLALERTSQRSTPTVAASPWRWS
jgi:glyoxylase-like metal-dependent hydrolase (beta-lactamase superfamily II)